MAINLDHVTEQITVTDTATNADLTLVTKGTGAIKFNNAGGTFANFLSTGGTLVSYPEFAGSQYPNVAYMGVNGTGTNISLQIGAKNAGQLIFQTANATQFLIANTASAVNYLQVTGSATGANPIFSAQGSDTNISIAYIPKGTGSHFFYGPSLPALQINSQPANTNYAILTSTSTSIAPLLQVVGTDTNVDFRFRTQGTGGYQFDTGSNLNSQLRLTNTASAVNYVQVTGAATGNGVSITSQGSDSDIYLDIKSKGTRPISFYTSASAGPQFKVEHSSSAVNYIAVNGSSTGGAVRVIAAGSDTNIPLVLQPKGTGALQAQQTDSTATGGNARGTNAVDFQTSRGAASNVASGGNSFIGSGNGNTVTSSLSSCVSGNANSVSGYSSFIGAGNSNTASNVYSSVTTGVSNTASNFYTTVVNGNTNTAAGYYNFIGNGQSNSGTSGSTVTTQSGTMNGTTAVTLSGSNANIKVGQYITGTSIAADTYVAAVSGTSLTLSKVASGSSTSTLSFLTPHGVVVGGGNNQATGSYSFIGGGGDAGTAANRNVASGDWSTVGGGGKNVASGIASFVGGGGFDGTVTNGNIASGSYSIVVGGSGNTASGTGSFIGGGNNNVASASNSAVLNGFQNTANSAMSSSLGGRRGITRGIIGNAVFSACDTPMADANGVSQSSLLILARQTTDATATVLSSNSASANTTNQVILPNNSAYFFTGKVVAGVTGGGNTKGWTIEGVIKRGANAASTTLVGTPTVTSSYADAGASTWVIAVTADTTNGGLAVTFTGQASTTIRTVAQIRTTEMTF